MKFNNTTRIALIVLIILISGGVGWLSVFSPMLERLGQIEGEIKSKQTEIASAQVIISENMALREQYNESLQKAVDAQKIFYPEMTTTQTINEVNNILASGGFKTESGISVSKISSSVLSITLSEIESSVDYEVRQHSFLNDNVMTENTETTNENNLTRSEAFKLLEQGQFSGTEKDSIISFLRTALAMESIEIGRISVQFSLELDYAEYLSFLDLIENNEKAICIQEARFRGDDISHDEKENYNFEIYLYVVKPVEEL